MLQPNPTDVLVLRSTIATPISRGYNGDSSEMMRSEVQYHSFHDTVEEANAAVKKLFFANNPYGWSAYELSREEVDVEHNKLGLCTMCVYPSSCPWWEVTAVYMSKEALLSPEGEISSNVEAAAVEDHEPEPEREPEEVRVVAQEPQEDRTAQEPIFASMFREYTMQAQTATALAPVLAPLMSRAPVFELEEIRVAGGSFYVVWTDLDDKDGVYSRWEYSDGKKWMECRGEPCQQSFSLVYRGGKRCLTPSPLFAPLFKGEILQRVRVIIFNTAMNSIGFCDHYCLKGYSYLDGSTQAYNSAQMLGKRSRLEANNLDASASMRSNGGFAGFTGSISSSFGSETGSGQLRALSLSGVQAHNQPSQLNQLSQSSSELPRDDNGSESSSDGEQGKLTFAMTGDESNAFKQGSATTLEPKTTKPRSRRRYDFDGKKQLLVGLLIEAVKRRLV